MKSTHLLLAGLLLAGCAGTGTAPNPTNGAYRSAELTMLKAVPEQGGTLQAQLREGLSVTLDLGARTTNADGTQVWTGYVVGDPTSMVTVGRYQDATTGTVVCAQGAFELAWQPDGQVLVTERDPATRGQCGNCQANPHQAGGVQPKVSDLRPAAVSNVDLYCVYTPAVVTKLGSEAAVKARLAEQVAESNVVFTNSNVEVKLNLVGSELVNYTQAAPHTVTGADLEEFSIGSAFQAVRAKRSELGIDLYKLILTVSPEPGSFFTSGIAWLPSQAFPLNPDSGFSVTSVEGFDNYTFVHEIGHNFGCNHDTTASNPPVPPERALYPFAYGYRKPGAIASIMAYSQGETKIPNFSNPNVSVGGEATGVANQSENWKAMNQSAPTIANYSSAATPSPTPGAPITVPLNTGWNAVAMQRELLTTLNGNSSIAGMAFLTNGTYQTRSFTLDDFNGGADGTRRGFFIFATGATEFSYTGRDDSQGSYANLRNGWNLCGFVTAADFPASKLAARQGNTTVPLNSVVLTQFQEIQPDNTYRTVDVGAPGAMIKAGRAYFVFSLGNVLITY